ARSPPAPARRAPGFPGAPAAPSSRSNRPGRATPPSASGTGADSATPARRRPVRGTRGASTPENPAYRPVLPGCASTPSPGQPRGGPGERGARRRDPCGCSSVAHGAGGQVLRIPDRVFFRQLSAALQLVGRRLPAHVEDLRARPEVALRVAVTVEAPFH